MAGALFLLQQRSCRRQQALQDLHAAAWMYRACNVAPAWHNLWERLHMRDVPTRLLYCAVAAVQSYGTTTHYTCSHMGAAIRFGLPAADPWRQRAQQVRAVVLGEARAELGSSDVVLCSADVNAGLLRAAAGTRLAASAATPSHRAHSRAGRPLRPLVHISPLFNPVRPCWLQTPRLPVTTARR